MFKTLKDVVEAMSYVILFVAYSFSWVLGTYTALSLDQEFKWVIFDIVASIFVPFYGTGLWLIRIVFG